MFKKFLLGEVGEEPNSNVCFISVASLRQGLLVLSFTQARAPVICLVQFICVAMPLIIHLVLQRHIIHALHYVPAILAGQRRLMMQLHRRLDRAEAATLTIAEVRGRKGG